MRIRHSVSRLTVLLVLAALVAVSLTTSCSHPRTYETWQAAPPSGESGAQWSGSYCTQRFLIPVGESACDAGDGFGCAVAARLLAKEASVAQAGGPDKRELALELADDGCDAGSEMACSVYMHTLFLGDHDDREEAVEQFKGMCLDRQGFSCLMLGRAYEISEREVNDRRVAAGLYKRACDDDLAEGCRRFADAYQRGFGVGYNPKRAAHFRHKACELGDEASCAAIEQGKSSAGAASNLDEEKLGADFIDMLDRGCNEAFPAGCTLAGLWAADLGTGQVAEHPSLDAAALARRFFERGCELGEASSCERLDAQAPAAASASSALACAPEGVGAALTEVVDALPGLYVAQTGVNAVLRFEERCTDGDAWACGKAGYRHSHGMGVSIDKTKARALYKKGCDGGEQWVCNNLAVMFDNGEGGRRLPKRARVLYRGACESGDALACNNLGTMLESGDGGPKDIEEAAEYYEDACDDDADIGCRNLGKLYRDGHGVEQDLDEAADYFRQACEMDDGTACKLLARVLQEADDNNKARDAVRYFAEACQKDTASSCRELGQMYLEGRGVDANPQQAMAFFMKGCHAEDSDSCERAVELYEKELIEEVDDHTIDSFARRVTENAVEDCESDDAYQCARAGYLSETGFGVEASYKTALGLYQRACKLGSGWGCRNLAHLYWRAQGTERDAAKAATFYQKACDEKDNWGCFGLAQAYATGEGIEQDDSRAGELFKEACERDLAQACQSLAYRHFRGRGVPKDQKEALRLAKAACEESQAGACLLTADIYEGAHGVERDVEEALSYFEKACELGRDRGCNRAVRLLAKEDTDPGGEKRRVLLEKGCERDGVFSCARLAYNMRHGRFHDQPDQANAAKYGDRVIELGSDACREDKYFGCAHGATYLAYGLGTKAAAPQEAQTMLQQACDRDSEAACSALALERASGGYIERDRKAAQQTLARQCQEGRSVSCCNAGFYSYRGWDDEIDLSRAASSFESSCREGNWVSCNNLAQMTAAGLGTRKDRARAVELMKRSCEHDHGAHCVSGAVLRWEVAPEKEELAEIARRAEEACDEGSGQGCVLQGQLMEAGAGTSRDLTGAQKLYTIACETHHYAPGCAHLDALGRVEASKFAQAPAVEATQACKAGANDACLAAGLKHERDYTNAGRMARAGATYKVACQRDDATACVLYIQAGADELGPLTGTRFLSTIKSTCALGPAEFCGDWARFMEAIDSELGVELMRRACPDGHQPSCRRLEDLGKANPEE